MSQHEEVDYSNKGAKFLKVLLFFALFIIFLIWIYQQNQNGLPGQ